MTTTSATLSGAQASPPAPPRSVAVRCRRIEPGDDAPLAALLAQGFPARGLAAWRGTLARLRAWTEAEALPGFGFVLEEEGRLVGCLLTLYAAGGGRCNMSSWYVAEGYRRYGSMLVNLALRDRSVTYLNVTSERHTRPIIEAQGFRRFADGVVLAAPLLAVAGLARARVSRHLPAEAAADPAEQRLVADHARLGCITFWCLAQGRAFPFVAVRRQVRGALPIAQIVYCAAETDWRLVSHAVGRALARHGLFLMLVDARGPLPGLPGRFLRGRMPKYARGSAPPHCGDLAYTEIALIGT
ncbi:GNAT family N-acetyltransferase [Methylobacterium nonmethylotrophicum]|uniref:GNAT family N-acetyltransferase n=1 Tax=Methylobacterium nonmethylotrophicum TaxID=1141884 RepID=A0A4Z0NQV1_9HYPH|nr:GNAT family N-acetyltransferase [Methylobacterium nonmethylotrophicum]TGD99412.1 GNAT family N-acetyltransferase [Methylobacterium nonmethylotrophicum]